MGGDANPAYLVGASVALTAYSAPGKFSCRKIPQFCSTPPERVPLHLHCMTEGAKLQGQGWQNNCQMFPARIGTHGRKGGVGLRLARSRVPFPAGPDLSSGPEWATWFRSISPGERRSSQVVSLNLGYDWQGALTLLAVEGGGCGQGRTPQPQPSLRALAFGNKGVTRATWILLNPDEDRRRRHSLGQYSSLGALVRS